LEYPQFQLSAIFLLELVSKPPNLGPWFNAQQYVVYTTGYKSRHF